MRLERLHGVYRRRGKRARPTPAVHDDLVRRRFVADVGLLMQAVGLVALVVFVVRLNLRDSRVRPLAGPGAALLTLVSALAVVVLVVVVFAVTGQLD